MFSFFLILAIIAFIAFIAFIFIFSLNDNFQAILAAFIIILCLFLLINLSIVLGNVKFEEFYQKKEVCEGEIRSNYEECEMIIDYKIKEKGENYESQD